MKETDENRFPRKISDRERRRLDPQRQNKRVWFGLGMFGIVGWSIALPAVAGAFFGIWLDSALSGKAGRYSWTLMLFMAGLCLGCWNAWRWTQRERDEITGRKESRK